jgi:pimeloyl-ACP methyl ester carboxylesterase
MEGTKALAIENWAKDREISSTRFDYFAHGQSSGNFTDGTLTIWLADTLAVLDELTTGPQVLIGSSMGGWLALLAALARPERVKALVLIAPAPDFTGDLMWDTFSDEVKTQLRAGQPYEQPSEYEDEPYLITPQLIEDGKTHFLLGSNIAVSCPVRIIQGCQDPDVPWERTIKLIERLASLDVDLTLLKSGDHRLSDPHALDVILKNIDNALSA